MKLEYELRELKFNIFQFYYFKLEFKVQEFESKLQFSIMNPDYLNQIEVVITGNINKKKIELSFL